MRSIPWKKILVCLLAVFTAASVAGCDLNRQTEDKGVVISEIVTSNKETLRNHPVYGSQEFTEKYGSPDWIELHNESDHAIDLLGWCITDNIKNIQKFELPDVTLQPDEYLLLLGSDKDNKTGKLSWDGQSPIFLGFSLKSSGETLLLVRPDAQIVDEITIPKLNRDVSYARRSDGTFGFCDVPTPGSANLNITDEVTAGVVINEVVSSNSESYLVPEYGSPDWIELHNDSDQPISLLGWGVTDNTKNSDKTFKLPDVTIEPDGYLLLLGSDKKNRTDPVSWDGKSPILLGFSLKSTGETIVLLSPSMQEVDRLSVPELHSDISFARRGNGTFGYCETPTPGAANLSEILDTQPPAKEDIPPVPVTGLEISEVSPRNTQIFCGGCLKCDWVELHNTTDRDIPIVSFTLCDELRDYDDANLSGVVPANGYLLVFCCEKNCTTKDAHVCVELGVSRYGDTLYLFDGNGFELDRVTIPSMPYKDVTWARRADGTFGYCETPTPNAANTAEITNEPPVRQEEPQDEPDDKSEEPVDPTLHARRPTGLRISEALAKNTYSITDKTGERCDWVELYNASDSPIALAGWYLSDNPKNLTKWALPGDTSLPNGSYLVVFLSGKTDVTGELHASFSLSEGETLYLYNDRTKELDWITVPALPDNVSIGLDEFNNQVYYRYPTPGEPNGHGDKNAEAIGFFQPDGVYISEVCAIHDRGSSEKDWIELYNGGETAVSLDGWYLSDSIDDLQKYRISSMSLGAHGYGVIEASASAVDRKAGDAAFGVSPSGETLYLSDTKGIVRDAFQTGVQRNGMSSGRIEGDDQTCRVFFTKKTKGKQNSDARYSGYTAQPVFSDTALYHTETFTLTLTCPDPNAVIRYTTDGSEPDEGSTQYTGPIGISKNTVIRAIAFSDNLLRSEIVTFHYLFEQPHTLPVVCIAMSPQDFNAVYKVKLHKDIKERKGYVNYYETDGLMGTAFPCDIKAKGQGTLKYISQKSLSLSLRAQYGMSHVDYPFFPGYAYTRFGSFALRQAGQDYDKARLCDAFASRACLGLNVDCANSRFCVVYINGSYYGIYDFNEELNSRYLETHFGVDPDTVNTIMRNGAVARKGTNSQFKSDFNAAKNANLSSDSAYEKFIEKVDPDAFIDYVICRQVFLDTDCFNQKYWRTTDYGIKWRPLLYDMDLILSSGSSRNIAYLYFNKGGTPSANGSLTYFYFTVALKTNAGWRQKFIERYVELVMTQLSSERLTALLDQMTAELEPEMQRHIDRWRYPRSMSNWKSSIKTLREKLEKRPMIALEHIQKEFKISQSEMDALIAKYRH